VMLMALDDLCRCTNAWAIFQVALSLDTRERRGGGKESGIFARVSA
jgi:hypothetical protein